MSTSPFFFDDAPAPGPVKRGRRLLTVDPGITSELGGLDRPASAPAGTPGGGVTTPTKYASSVARADLHGGVKMFASSGKQSTATTDAHPVGKRRNEDKGFFETDPTRTDRGDFVVASWEQKGKKICEPEERVEKPVGLHLIHKKEVDIPPFATSSGLNPIPFHRQRRCIAVPGADNEEDPVYVPKRSRTPPASVKPKCESEGFTVVYSTNTAEKQKLVAGGLRMIPFDHHGKGTTTTASKIAEKRAADEAKRDAQFISHRQYLHQVAERIVDARKLRPSGKRWGAYHPPERDGGPNAMDLPLPANYIVGKSCARARTPRAGGGGGPVSPSPATSRPGWKR